MIALVVDNTARRSQLAALLEQEPPEAVRLEVALVKREVALRIERRQRRMRWVRTCYQIGRALGALAILAAAAVMGASLVYGAGVLAWWLS